MFSDIFVGIFVFLYNAAPVAFVIAVILTVLNGVRRLLVNRRSKRVQRRRALQKSNHFPTFDTL